jgi:SAM-dependent methyltransferase
MENNAAGYAMEEMRPRFQTLAGRHDNGTAPRAVVAFNLFQTPREVAARMAELACVTPGARVLEPSAGPGRLIDAVRPYQPGHVVAVEIAPQCAAELYRREDCTLRQSDFLTLHPPSLGYFDRIIMNPPFHLRADIKHIQHARQMLNPGGKLVALCMATHHREDALRPLCCHWERLPAESFKAEGTKINVVLLVMEAK